MTLRDVVDLPVVQQGQPQVLSAHRWEETIRWVHVIDVEDLSTLLQGGELVLCTGVALGSAPRRYLQGLADAGALGVVVELGNALSAVPDEVVALAKRLNLALVALHRQTRFVDVTEAVHRRIVAAQYDEVSFARRVHETFTQLSMQRASADGIVDAAGHILDEAVVLEDLAHQALVVTANGKPAATVLADWEQRSRMSPTDDGGREGWAVISVGPRGEEWGRLIVPNHPRDRSRTRMVLERAGAALALHQMIERSRSGLHQQAQSGLIDDVLQSRITDESEAAARAHALGLRKGMHYFPVVVRAEQPNGHTDPVAAQRYNIGLLDVVAHTVNATGHSGLFSIRRDGEIGAVLALNTERGSTQKALTTLGQRLRAALGCADGAPQSVCAIGEPATDITDVIRGLRQAAHVAEVAIAMGADTRPFFQAADLRLRGLIALLRDDPRVQHFAESELKALLACQATSDLSHLDVLRQYLQLAGNKAAVAQRLHLSRPALYKRLSTIGRILRVDLDDPESMTSLHVAVLILDSQRRADRRVLAGRTLAER